MLFRVPRRLQVYLAGPLFSEAELEFNRRVTEAIEGYVDVFLPQRDGGRLTDLVFKGVDARMAYRSIYDRDVQALREADVLLLVMDGRAIDEGAAFELGYAVALNKPCFGLQTDTRRLLPLGNNPMIQVPLKAVFGSIPQVSAWAQAASEQFAH